MSLVGNLEDLGLGDILQIVSLSRKSGVLTLSSLNRVGTVVFSNGQVIRATSSVFKDNLGHLLLQRDIVDLATLKRALTLQRNTPEPPRLGDILIDKFKIPKEKIEEAIKSQIEKIVYSFFTWSEGTFSFQLGEQEEQSEVMVNSLEVMLSKGINTQWLAMEGSRLVDEMRHEGVEFEEEEEVVPEFEELICAFPKQTGAARTNLAVAPEPVAEYPDLVFDHVVLIDDDEQIRKEIAARLNSYGLEVTSFGSVAECLQGDQIQSWENKLLLVDLIMPRKDGSGILGGLELLQTLHDTVPINQVVVVTDHPNAHAEAELGKLGFKDVRLKPRKDMIRDGRAQQQLDNLVAQIVAKGSHDEEGAESAEGFHHLGRELFSEMGDESEARPANAEEKTPGLHLLKKMLMELHNPSLGGGITLLVLRFAAEIMNRAVLFMVKDDQIVGLGQFGIQLRGLSADDCVRRMSIPRNEYSLFSVTLAQKEPQRVRPGNGTWDRYLIEQLGGDRPKEVYTGPIVTDGKVVAVLYGDNLPDNQAIGDTMALDIFLSQAGVAMERALLERRLRSQGNDWNPSDQELQGEL